MYVPCMCVRLYVGMYVCAGYVCTYVRMCAYIDVYVYVCINACTCMWVGVGGGATVRDESFGLFAARVNTAHGICH